MIETVCAKFRKQNHPNNTLLLTWAAFLSHFRPILHDLKDFFSRDPCEESSGRADDEEDRRGAVRAAGGAGR